MDAHVLMGAQARLIPAPAALGRRPYSPRFSLSKPRVVYFRSIARCSIQPARAPFWLCFFVFTFVLRHRPSLVKAQAYTNQRPCQRKRATRTGPQEINCLTSQRSCARTDARNLSGETTGTDFFFACFLFFATGTRRFTTHSR